MKRRSSNERFKKLTELMEQLCWPKTQVYDAGSSIAHRRGKANISHMFVAITACGLVGKCARLSVCLQHVPRPLHYHTSLILLELLLLIGVTNEASGSVWLKNQPKSPKVAPAPVGGLPSPPRALLLYLLYHRLFWVM